MNIVVTGATGFIGRYAISYLQGKGHSITALVRNIERAKDLLGGDVEIADDNLLNYKIDVFFQKNHSCSLRKRTCCRANDLNIRH